jgi:predicted Holliday junction resolvase-like endonuclease
MEIAIFISNIVIFILLIFVTFIQKRTLASKEKIIQDYKDIPELAKIQSSMREEITKLEAKKKMEELKKKFYSDKKKSVESLSEEAYELYRVISNLIFAYADYWYFEMVIKNMKSIATKENLVDELNKRKEYWLTSKNYSTDKLLREVVLQMAYEKGKLSF